MDRHACACRNNAVDLLGEKSKLGSIEAGKLADIVAVDGDPLKDNKIFGKVVFVRREQTMLVALQPGK